MDYKLPLSPLYAQIADAARAGHVRADAVAGAGKTTTSLGIAQLHPEWRCLGLTYNSRLKTDGRAKVRALGLTNIVIHSFHSACRYYYDTTTRTDSGIINAVDNGLPSLYPESFDILMVDECQDMTRLYFQFVLKVHRELCRPDTPIIIYGDIFQTIYVHNGADPNYIRHADEIMYDDRKWSTIKMDVSYRVPSIIAAFVNDMLGTQRIRAHRTGGEIATHSVSSRDATALEPIVAGYLRDWSPSQIFIIAPRVRAHTNRSLRSMINYIKRTHPDVLLHVPSDDHPVSERSIANKLLVASIHQTKGLEAPVVIVYGWNEITDDNVRYVAATRAIHRLCIVTTDAKPPQMTRVPTRSVTDFLRGHPSVTLHRLMTTYVRVTPADIECKALVPPLSEVRMTHHGVTYTEQVSHLYGIGVTLLAEHIRKGTRHPPDPATLIREANRIASSCNYNHQMRQIRNYRWVQSETFDECARRIADAVGPTARFEVSGTYSHPAITLTGRADVIDEDIWEVKFSGSLIPEQTLQVAVYSVMFPHRHAYLYTPLTGQRYKVEVTDARGLVDALCASYFDRLTPKPLEDFREDVRQSHASYIAPQPLVTDIPDGMEDY